MGHDKRQGMPRHLIEEQALTIWKSHNVDPPIYASNERSGGSEWLVAWRYGTHFDPICAGCIHTTSIYVEGFGLNYGSQSVVEIEFLSFLLLG